MEDILTTMMMELGLNPEEYPYNNNTKALLIFRYNMAVMAKAIIETTDMLTKPQNLDVSQLVVGLVESIEWLDQNLDLTGKEI